MRMLQILDLSLLDYLIQISISHWYGCIVNKKWRKRNKWCHFYVFGKRQYGTWILGEHEFWATNFPPAYVFQPTLITLLFFFVISILENPSWVYQRFPFHVIGNNVTFRHTGANSEMLHFVNSPVSLPKSFLQIHRAPKHFNNIRALEALVSRTIVQNSGDIKNITLPSGM